MCSNNSSRWRPVASATSAARSRHCCTSWAKRGHGGSSICPCLASRFCKQFAQLGHALDRLRLVVVAQRLQQVLDAAGVARARSRVRKLPLNCGSSSSICFCTSSMSCARRPRRRRRGLDRRRLAAVAAALADAHLHRDGVLDVDGQLDLDRRADRQRRVEIVDDHLLDDAIFLEDRHDDAAGLVVGAARAVEHARQRGADRGDDQGY